jgi:hypothetical protein
MLIEKVAFPFRRVLCVPGSCSEGCLPGILIVIAGREPRHKANPLGVSAAHRLFAAFEPFAHDGNSAQDRCSSMRNQELIVGAIWHMIAALSPRGIRT